MADKFRKLLLLLKDIENEKFTGQLEINFNEGKVAKIVKKEVVK